MPQLSSVETAIFQFAYYVERKLFGMHFRRYSLSLLGTQIKDLCPTLQMLLSPRLSYSVHSSTCLSVTHSGVILLVSD